MRTLRVAADEADVATAFDALPLKSPALLMKAMSSLAILSSWRLKRLLAAVADAVGRDLMSGSNSGREIVEEIIMIIIMIIIILIIIIL